LHENFLDDLTDDIEEFEHAINRKIQKHEAQISATAAIDPVIERGLNIVRELDVIIRNKYPDDAATLAAWLSMSHTQRTQRRPTETPPNATPKTPPSN
jgi:hypothetical protein